MRWYVSRNGDTQGPFDDAVVAQWVRHGMRDATVRDEAGGPWVPIGQSPFGALLPKTERTSPLAFVAALVTISVLVTVLVGVPAGGLFFVAFGVIGLCYFGFRD